TGAEGDARFSMAESLALRGQRRVQVEWMGLKDLQAVQVQHCHGARAVSVTWPSPARSSSSTATSFKVSYSGDCRPSKAFARIGQHSTVLIHEATFDDELHSDAVAKNHSTTSEALAVAAGMKARSAVLTHFSQRYQKVPVLDEREGNADGGGPMRGPRVEMDEETVRDADAAGEPQTMATYKPRSFAPSPSPPPDAVRGDKVTTVRLAGATGLKFCVAFDYMRVRVGEIAQLARFTPALVALFAEEEGQEGEGGGGGGGWKGAGRGGGRGVRRN
ncbi:hypothetical protein LTR66_015895, partial [Elasticomyces elasticus]